VSEKALPRPASRIEVAVEEMPQLVGRQDANLRSIEKRFDVQVRPADSAVYSTAPSRQPSKQRRRLQPCCG